MAHRNTLIAALLVTVLLGHGLVLEWLTRQAQAEAAIRLMPPPMFTRLLQQQAPAPAPGLAAASPRRARTGEAIRSVARPAQEDVTNSAPVPGAAADTAAVESTPTVAISPEPEEAVASRPGTATLTAAAPIPEAVTATAAETASPTAPATATASAATSAWPADTRLNYKVGGYFRGELHGNARVQWQREGERYQTRIDIDLGVVSVVMTSQGEITPQGLAPTKYEETRAGKRRSALLQETRILLSDGREVPRPERVQDTASQFVELSHRFASGELPLEVGRSVTFWMARPGGVDLWTYDVVNQEILQTPQLGAVEAFHLKPRPQPNPRGNITAEMWFAPSLQYLPVRIRVTTGDAHLDLFVEKIEQR